MEMTKCIRSALFASVMTLMLFPSVAVAYDPVDPYGSIDIKWDIMSWTADGYVAAVTMWNNQMYRNIMSPGWSLGWTWAKKEVIWSMVGAKVTDQGDCSKFKGNNIPHCCEKTPTVIDLLPGVPYNKQLPHCCKGGAIASLGQDPSAAVSVFQLSVGLAGTSNKTVKPPKYFFLLGPGPGYTCSAATVVPSSVTYSPDGRSKTRAMMSWSLTCTYSQLLASKHPKCCVSLSSFYNPIITPCPSCSCGCEDANNCVNGGLEDSSLIQSKTSATGNPPKMLQCTEHMCPIRVHWHVKANYKKFWRVKITINNFNYQMNYTQWTLVAQHPNLNNLVNISSFHYKPLIQYNSKNDTGMFYGIKKYNNDLLMQAGPKGYIHTHLILRKDKKTFTLDQGWAFPLRIYFNGDECVMPLPDMYPYLPKSASNSSHPISTFSTLAAFLFLVMLVFL